jgi:GTPase SAR1 family protein
MRVHGCDCSVHCFDNSGAELAADGFSSSTWGNLSVMIVYDVTVPSSFDAVPQWIATLTSISDSVLVPFVLVGNKSDLDGKFDQSRVKQFVNEYKNLLHFETSARTNDGVDDAFTALLQLAFQPAPIKKKKPLSVLETERTDILEGDTVPCIRFLKTSRCCLLL